MADDTTTATEEAPQDASTQTEPKPEPFDEARARATITAQRAAEREAKAALATATKELEDLRKKQKERDDADLSEAEKATARANDAEKRATEAEERLKTANTQRAIEREAGKLNFHDPEDAIVQIVGKLEYDPDGKPTNVEAALKALATAKPYLVKSEASGKGVPSTPNGGRPASQAEVISKTQDEMRRSGAYSL